MMVNTRLSNHELRLLSFINLNMVLNDPKDISVSEIASHKFIYIIHFISLIKTQPKWYNNFIFFIINYYTLEPVIKKK